MARVVEILPSQRQNPIYRTQPMFWLLTVDAIEHLNMYPKTNEAASIVYINLEHGYVIIPHLSGMQNFLD